MVAAGFVGPFGIGPQGTAQTYEVALAGGQDLLGVFRQGDGAGGDDGHMHVLLDGLGRPYIVAHIDGHGGYLVDHGVVIAARNMERVDAFLFQRLGQLDGVLNREAVRLVIRAAQADGDGHVRADLLAHVAGDFQVDAHAVFQAAAVQIGAVVGMGGEEVGQQVAVRAMNFDDFKAGGFGAAGGVAKGMYDILDFLDGQHMRHGLHAILIPQLGPGQGGSGADGLGAQELLAAAVLNLDGGHGAVFTDALGQPGQAGNVLVAGNAQVAVRAFGADFIHIGVFHNDRARAALGLVGVVADGALGHSAVLVVHARRLRSLEDAVFQRHIADLGGGGEDGEHLRFHGCASFVISRFSAKILSNRLAVIDIT